MTNSCLCRGSGELVRFHDVDDHGRTVCPECGQVQPARWVHTSDIPTDPWHAIGVHVEQVTP